MPRARNTPPSDTIKNIREQHELLALQTLEIHSRIVRRLSEDEAALRPKPKPPVKPF